MHVAITGATGLIGTALYNAFAKRGDSVSVITRNADQASRIFRSAFMTVSWDNRDNLLRCLDSADVVINLAGASLAGGLWTGSYKEKILSSRVRSTRSLVNAISETGKKDRRLISASATGYYDQKSTVPLDENSPRGTGFLSDVCEAWEKEARLIDTVHAQTVIVRIGVVLDAEKGALPKMILPFRFFAGGYTGSGEQWLSWIHIEDLTSVFLFLAGLQGASGVYNAVAPLPVRMKEFSKTAGSVLGRPGWLNVPESVLDTVLGEAAVMVTQGAQILPVRLTEAGYRFKFQDLKSALSDLLQG